MPSGETDSEEGIHTKSPEAPKRGSKEVCKMADIEMNVDDEQQISASNFPTMKFVTIPGVSSYRGFTFGETDSEEGIHTRSPQASKKRSKSVNTFGGMHPGFLVDRKVTRKRTETTETGDSVASDKEEKLEAQKQLEKKMRKKQRKGPKAEHVFPMAERPEIQKKKEEPETPEKCPACPKQIMPNEQSYKMNCSEKCFLFMHQHCFKDEMARQGKSRKKDQKNAICPTDGCQGKLYEILQRNLKMDSDEKFITYLVCNQRPTELTKEDKKNLKKKATTEKHDETAHARSFDRSSSETAAENYEMAIEQQPEPSKEPAQPVHIDLNASVVRLEKHNEIVDKYGLHDAGSGKREKERKKRNEKSMVTLNMVDKVMVERAERQRNESNDFDENFDISRESITPPFMEPRPSSAFSHHSNQAEFEPLLFDRATFPRVEDLNNLDFLVQEILPYKADILANAPETEELHELKVVFMAVLSDEQNPLTPSGHKLADIRKALENVFDEKHLTSNDGGLTRKFLDLTKWFTISRSGGKILFRKRPHQTATANVGSNVVVNKPPQFSQTTTIWKESRSTPSTSSETIKAVNSENFSSNMMSSSHSGYWAEIKDRQHSQRPSGSSVLMKQSDEPFLPKLMNLSLEPPGGSSCKIAPPPGIVGPVGMNRPPGILGVAQVSLPNPNFSMDNDHPEVKRLIKELQEVKNEKEDLEKASQSYLKENINLYKAKDRLRDEMADLEEKGKTKEKLYQERLETAKSERNKLLEQLNQMKLLNDEPKVKHLQTELTKLQKDNHLNSEKRAATKRKEMAEMTIYHIEQICHLLQGYLIDERLEGEKLVLRKRQNDDFEQIRSEWETIQRAAVKRLYELNTNDLSDTVIPLPPHLTVACEQLYDELLQQPILEMNTLTIQILKEIGGRISSQCTRYEIPQPDEAKLEQLLARYIADNQIILGVTRKINSDKCLNYVLDQLGVPRSCTSMIGSAWQRQQPPPASHPTYSSPPYEPSTNNHTFSLSASKGSSAPKRTGHREIDYSIHECSICIEKVVTKTNTRQCPDCGEPFHVECIKKWLKTTASKTNDCPVCNHVWPDEDEYPSL